MNGVVNNQLIQSIKFTELMFYLANPTSVTDMMNAIMSAATTLTLTIFYIVILLSI